jgi:hypothetical protein
MKKGERRAFARSTVRAFLIAGLIFVWLELFLACVILPFMLVYEETESEGLALLVAAVTFFIFCGISYGLHRLFRWLDRRLSLMFASSDSEQWEK